MFRIYANQRDQETSQTAAEPHGRTNPSDTKNDQGRYLIARLEFCESGRNCERPRRRCFDSPHEAPRRARSPAVRQHLETFQKRLSQNPGTGRKKGLGFRIAAQNFALRQISCQEKRIPSISKTYLELISGAGWLWQDMSNALEPMLTRTRLL